MVERQRMAETELAEQLSRLDSWEVSEGNLQREFQFENFVEAFDCLFHSYKFASVTRKYFGDL